MELSLEYYISHVENMVNLKSKIDEQRGNAAERINKARVATADELATDAETTAIPQLIAWTVGDLLEWADDVAEWAHGVRDNHVENYLKGLGDSVESVEALVEQFQSAETVRSSLATLLGQMGEDLSKIDVPTIRKPRGTGGSSKKNSKGQRFYRIVNGERKNQSDSQNSWSSFCFYHAATMMGENEFPGTKAATKWAEANVEGFSLGKPWSTVIDGVTYGMDVETPADDETPADETPADD